MLNDKKIATVKPTTISPLTHPTPATPRQPGAVPGLVIVVVILSFLIGGISGALFSGWLASNSQAMTWVQETLFGQPAGSVAAGSVSAERTLKVTEDSATVDVVKKVSPAVVSIVITQDLSKIYGNASQNISPFDRFFNITTPTPTIPEGQQEVGAGTGFIISADGLILTNKHVVSTDNAQYTVVTNDGTKYDATVLDTDPLNDIALIKIDAKDLPMVELGDSDPLQIGQTVIAIGNTLGQYSNTVTKGVVSGLARTVTANGGSSGASETLEDTIQTDAAINLGNSGGPLLNLAGQVIGVNTAINSSGQLIGFAIPINQAKRSIDSVKQFGKIIRPYLGVRYIVINEAVAKENNLTIQYGALVVRGAKATDLAVIPGSPADKAGLVENDIILEVNSQKIDEDHSLAKQLQKYNVGDTITLKVLSKGVEKTVTAILEELK